MRQDANPVLWLVIALPLLGVAGSIASLALAVTRGDSELPKSYHWEGDDLERDRQLQAAALRLGVGAAIEFDAAAGRCAVALRSLAPGPAPAGLRLTLTHPTDPAADRRVDLRLEGGRYVAPCAPLPAAHWWLELADDQGRWLLRGRALGDLQPAVRLGAGAAVPQEAR
jgi:uncharacterized protein